MANLYHEVTTDSLDKLLADRLTYLTVRPTCGEICIYLDTSLSDSII